MESYPFCGVMLCRQSREREQKMPKRQLLHVDLYFRRNQDANTENKRKLNEDHQYEESLFLQ